ncbi:hypothetical protein D9756_002986 [Leucocoprinus leucothites]|uniref:Uncharacterized protein n=1 Tax=Leucocoprinus leucothites TaxID=201217 RepID=A0A8H5G6M7_9AGAR|nr:hypothetical protein D9756_002986 [Leucoagaricus leucothites]
MTSNPDVPPFIGYVETTVHALRLIHAARQGVIPRITRRLNDSERRTMIKSGAVFVFSVEESGIKRWTDGLLWSPSRIVGNFLVYREINERSSSRSGHKKPYPQDDPSGRNLARRSSPDQLSYKSLTNGHSSNDQGTFKPNGLIKKTITVTIEGSDLHLISYYTSEDIRSGLLKRPTSRPDIMGLYMPPHIFRLTNFRVPPKVEIGPDGKPRLVCEAEDLPAPECKVEEPVYRVPDPSGWISCTTVLMPVDNVFTGSPVHSLSHGGHSLHSNMYGRSNASDRWSNSGTENFSLSSMTVRPEPPWTPTLHSSHPSIARRRDNSHLSPPEPWSSLSGSTSRWLGSHDVPSSHSSPYLEPRARIRSPGHPYGEAASIRRDPESMSPSYIHRFPAHCQSARDNSTHRGISWHQRDVESLKDSRSHAGHHTDTSFTPSPTLPFSNSGYHQPHHQPQHHSSSHSYSSSWSSTDTSAMEAPAALQANLSYDTTAYAPSSTAMSGSTDFANVDDM